MKTRFLIIIGIIVVLFVPASSAQGLPVIMDCKYEPDFIISTNKLEFIHDETFVLNVKTIQKYDFCNTS
jgi:hypothetical protein